MLSLFVVASSAAAAPLAVAVADSTNATAAATNTTTGMNTTTDAPLPEASDRRQRPWWERLAEKHRELRKGQSWCVLRSTHASLPRRGPWATKHSSTLCHTQGATASRVARGFKRKRGSARALFDLGSATAQRADGGRPSGLRSVLAAIGAPPERCCNRHATLTGRPFRRLHLSLSYPSQAAPLCETLCEAANRNSRTEEGGSWRQVLSR